MHPINDRFHHDFEVLHQAGGAQLQSSDGLPDSPGAASWAQPNANYYAMASHAGEEACYGQRVIEPKNKVLGCLALRFLN